MSTLTDLEEALETNAEPNYKGQFKGGPCHPVAGQVTLLRKAVLK